MVDLRLDNLVADLDRLEELRSLRKELSVICLVLWKFRII